VSAFPGDDATGGQIPDGMSVAIKICG
jgi:hypothetical protein